MAYENDPLAQDTAQVDLFGDKRTDVPEDFGALAGRFTVPPFSVLEPRQGYWQQRKRLWVKLGRRARKGGRISTRPKTFVPRSGIAVRNQNFIRPILSAVMATASANHKNAERIQIQGRPGTRRRPA